MKHSELPGFTEFMASYEETKEDWDEIHKQMGSKLASWNSGVIMGVQSKEHLEKRRKAMSKPKTGKALAATIANAMLGAEASRGRKDSEETKRRRNEAISKAKNGVPVPNLRKSMLIEGVEYKGFDAVIEKYNVTRQTVWNRAKSDKFPDWSYNGS